MEPISDEEVASLNESIANLVRSLCIKRGYLGKDGDIVLNPELDPLFQDHKSLTAALAASIVGKIAFGPNAGCYVRKIGSGFGYEGEVPLAKGKRCYSVNGFSLPTYKHKVISDTSTGVSLAGSVPDPKKNLSNYASAVIKAAREDLKKCFSRIYDPEACRERSFPKLPDQVVLKPMNN